VKSDELIPFKKEQKSRLFWGPRTYWWESLKGGQEDYFPRKALGVGKTTIEKEKGKRKGGLSSRRHRVRGQINQSNKENGQKLAGRFPPQKVRQI